MIKDVGAVDAVPCNQVGVRPPVVKHGGGDGIVGGVGGDEVEEDEGADHWATPQGDQGVHLGGQTTAVHSSTSLPHLGSGAGDGDLCEFYI